MKLTLALALAIALSAQPALAHDFWVLPERFQAAEGAPVKVSFRIGHGREVEPWNLTWERLHSFRSFGPGGLVDHQASIVPSGPGVDGGGLVTLKGAGTHVVAMESYHSTSVLPGVRFNEYVELEGLTAIRERRERDAKANDGGREVYSRRAKALIQVGDALSDTALRPVGHTLEIVPERNPYAPSTGRLPVRVLFQGRPLAGALIDLTALSKGTEPTQGQRTDAQGRATFDVPREGNWKINVIWGRPVEGRPDSDFDTVFASLTFGYAPAR